jgi:lipopolysaccharide/colanic/teichoic acid biosynthesis glycosyltransferase
MTSLVGAVQAVDSEELLESLRVPVVDRIAVNGELQHELLPGLGSHKLGRTVQSLARCEGTGRDSLATSHDRVIYSSVKRTFDILASVLGLFIFAPLFAFVALLTKVTDGGPVFYPHTRVGKWGREFKCLKFRTMVVDADNIKDNIAHLNYHGDHRTFKVPDDPRVTKVGRWLRCTSIDEVPQLWNVLRGEMSIVGPRPPVPREVEQYDLDDMQRLMVKPGLTCIWQVSGRSRIPFPEQLEMDLEYIERRNFWLDLQLILRTLPAVLSADGAY